jgi:hypothetical protein
MRPSNTARNCLPFARRGRGQGRISLDFAGRASVTADRLGLAVRGGEVGFLGVVASSPGIPFWGSIGAYAVLDFLAILGGHGDKSPTRSREVLMALLGSFLLGGLFFAGDSILGPLHHPHLLLVKAAEQSGGPVGFGLSLLACPVTTLFLLAGYFLDRAPNA